MAGPFSRTRLSSTAYNLQLANKSLIQAGLPGRGERPGNFGYRDVMLTVTEFGRVSVPPGPKVTVPLIGKTALVAFVALFVMFIVTIMVVGGLAPPLVEPPRDGVVQVMTPPLEPGAAPPQRPAPP